MNDHRCVVSGGYFLEPGCPYIDELKNKYKCKNPAFAQAQALHAKNKYVSMPPKHIHACQTIPLWHSWGGGLMIPRGIDMSPYKLKMLFRTGMMDDIQPYEFADGISLRDYQNDAVDRWIRAHRNGIIVAPCGAGKTMMGLGAITKCKGVKTIVLVHTADLASQWTERINAQLKSGTGIKPPHVTLYGNGKKDDSGDIVVASFQTLARMRFDDLLSFGKQFGLCIVDEAHHVPATTFSAVMFGMPASYRLALTATPDRPDGLSDIMYWHFGAAVKQIQTKDLIDEGRVLSPMVKFFPTYWEPLPHSDWGRQINQMCGDENRNEMIMKLIHSHVGQGRQVLVLSGRVKHCIELAETSAESGIPSATLVGAMTKKQRRETLKAAEDRQIKALFATSVADEGLDLPGLDTLILTTPTKSMGRIQQRIGRIMRYAPNKKLPIVIDMVDAAPWLYNMHKKRQKLYTDLGCKVKSIAEVCEHGL